VKLKFIDKENQFRRHIASMYLKGIKNENVILPIPNNCAFEHVDNKEHVWHLFVVRCKERDKFQEYLTENGIQTLIHYPLPPNKQLAYSDLNHLDFPITNDIHNEVLSLPLSPVITEDEVNKVIAVINNYNK